ncbi:MAG: DNA repair exonuclease, partial [Proteobacteria bacterium]|nr:DNA repair exonuclease [Pseudomonadota bacterium]
AVHEDVNFVVLAGDLYDGDWKDYNTGIFFHQEISRLGKHNIEVFSVAGNHDAANHMTKTLSLPENMKVFSAQHPETFERPELGVALHGQSYPSRSVTSNLAIKYPRATVGCFNIGVLHTSLDGREGHADYAPCSLSDLRMPGYDYWALGHVHKREVVRQQDPCVIFSGCLQGRNIHETGTKGCTLVEVTDGNITSIRAQAVDVVRWFLCQVDLTDITTLEDLEHLLKKEIESKSKEAEGLPMIVRIKLIGQTQMATDFRAHRDRWQSEIKAKTLEIANYLGVDLWLEKVKFATQPPQESSRGTEAHGLLDHLIQAIHQPNYTIDQVPKLPEKLAILRSKLPHSLMANPDNHGDDFSLDGPNLTRLFQEGKDMLVSQLITLEKDFHED